MVWRRLTTVSCHGHPLRLKSVIFLIICLAGHCQTIQAAKGRATKIQAANSSEVTATAISQDPQLHSFKNEVLVAWQEKPASNAEFLRRVEQLEEKGFLKHKQYLSIDKPRAWMTDRDWDATTLLFCSAGNIKDESPTLPQLMQFAMKAKVVKDNCNPKQDWPYMIELMRNGSAFLSDEREHISDTCNLKKMRANKISFNEIFDSYILQKFTQKSERENLTRFWYDMLILIWMDSSSLAHVEDKRDESIEPKIDWRQAIKTFYEDETVQSKNDRSPVSSENSDDSTLSHSPQSFLLERVQLVERKQATLKEEITKKITQEIQEETLKRTQTLLARIEALEANLKTIKDAQSPSSQAQGIELREKTNTPPPENLTQLLQRPAPLTATTVVTSHSVITSAREQQARRIAAPAIASNTIQALPPSITTNISTVPVIIPFQNRPEQMFRIEPGAYEYIASTDNGHLIKTIDTPADYIPGSVIMNVYGNKLVYPPPGFKLLTLQPPSGSK